MRKFRFQFTLRTVFIVSFIFAIICAGLKCKNDAENNFYKAEKIVYGSLQKVQRELDENLFNQWMEDAKANPTLPVLLEKFPSAKDRIPVVVNNQETHLDTIGLLDVFSIRKEILSPNKDFSQEISKNDYGTQIVSLNFSLIGPGYFGIFSRKTSISIFAISKPNNINDQLLSRMKEDLDDAGLSYKIHEVNPEEHKGY